MVFSELFRQRDPLYAAAADLRIDTVGKNHDQVADAILMKLEALAPR